MELLSSNSFLMMEKSMDFLWAKQAAILDNISNAETPNYKPKVVTFEETLREKLQRAQEKDRPRKETRAAIRSAEYSVKEKPVSTRMDDNGVNVTEQSVEMIRNAYQLQYVMKSINSDLTVLKAAIQG
ncbi:flagellar basal body rod protein FlgB [Oscillibacter valericigenes]|nr:flagellar basal body rod protein FlgB [Oscillibacter valericigenes]